MPRTVELRTGELAIVDDEDYELVRQFTWYALRQQTTYARCKLDRNHTASMHRLILNAPVGVLVDHRNGNGLDNQRGNLRYATGNQNSANRRMTAKEKRSPFKGVYRYRNRWRAVIRSAGEQISLGHFGTAEEAAAVYDAAAVRFFGQFAYTNFPSGSQVG